MFFGKVRNVIKFISVLNTRKHVNTVKKFHLYKAIKEVCKSTKHIPTNKI
jgi:hypothetical protein